MSLFPFFGMTTKFTLTRKISLLVSIPLVGTLVEAGVLTRFLRQTGSSGHFMNVAGRQRMLSAELQAWVHMVGIGMEEDRDGLRDRIGQFGEALFALRNGGEILDGHLDAAPPEVNEALASVEALWTGLEPDLRLIANTPREDPRFQQARERVRGALDELKARSHRVVEVYDERTRTLRAGLSRITWLVAGMTCAVFLASIFLTRRYIVRPILGLDRIARRIQEGDFSGRLEATTSDELSTLVTTFNQTAARVEQLLAEAQAREEQLRQAQKMEAVGRLAGGVAHDFNNLLQVILGYTDQMLAALATGSPPHRMAGEVRKAAERAATLTRQLLAFSRKQILQPRVLDLNALIEETGRMLAKLIGEDIRLSTWLDPDLGTVKADPGQLQQTIVNLVINARDAMPRGGAITIETRNVELAVASLSVDDTIPAGRYVLLAISDTGCGMDAETQKRIFEPFFTTKGPGKGTGLGLAMVHGFVKQSRGGIAVRSAPGEGSTFSIYLPRVDEKAEPSAAAHPTSASTRGVETILLAEDEPLVRSVVRQMLERLGYTVLEAHDGASAISVFRTCRQPIALVITDTVMPGMYGVDLVRRLREIRPDLKALYMSAQMDPDVAREVDIEAEPPLLQKPFDLGTLGRAVRVAIEEPMTASEIAPHARPRDRRFDSPSRE